MAGGRARSGGQAALAVTGIGLFYLAHFGVKFDTLPVHVEICGLRHFVQN